MTRGAGGEDTVRSQPGESGSSAGAGGRWDQAHESSVMTDISWASAVLVAWLGTAALGLVMLVTWIADGGPGAIRFTPALIFGHFLLAGAGLLVWVAYLFSGTRAPAWVAVGDLGLVALLGDFTLLRWLRLRRTGNRSWSSTGCSRSPRSPWSC